MPEKLSEAKRFIYFGLLIISLGLIYSTTLAESLGAFGMLFMVMGGLFFIIGMRKRKQEEDNKEG